MLYNSVAAKKRPFPCACQPESALLFVQNYLTMLGSTVLIPFTLVTAMGGTPDDLAAGMLAKDASCSAGLH